MTDDASADHDRSQHDGSESDFFEGVGFQRELFHSIPDVVFVLDEDGPILRWNDRLPSVSGYSNDEIVGMHPLEFVPDADELRIAAAVRNALEYGTVEVRESALVTKGGEHVPFEYAGARVTDEGGSVVGLVGTGRDISERKQYERALRRQRDELETLNRINAVVRDVNRALVGAKTIDRINDLVCERLAASELYRGVAVVQVDEARDRLTVENAVQIDEAHRETVESVYDGRVDESVASTALHTGEVQIVTDVFQDSSIPGDLQLAADERGLDSVACIPLGYDTSEYGVLAVHASRSDAFSPRECAVFEELGETVGHAINAIERKNALVADRVVELEFRVHEADSFVVAASSRMDAVFTLEGVVSKEGSTFLAYYAIQGGDGETVLRLAQESDAVDHARLVAGEDPMLFELVVEDPSLLTTFAERSARVTTVVAEDGTGRVVAELPTGADVRSVVDSFREAVPGADLVAQRTTNRTVQTTPKLRSELLAELTEKQRAVLRTAYFSGFFERPRRSSGEAVADAMDVAPSTFHQHLRVGLRKLLDALMDGPHEQ